MQRLSTPVEECVWTVMAIQLDGTVKPVHLCTTPGLIDSKQILMSVKVSALNLFFVLNVKRGAALCVCCVCTFVCVCAGP